MASSSKSYPDDLDLSKLVISKPVNATKKELTQKQTEKPPATIDPVILGDPVNSIEECSKHPKVVTLDENGYIKKRVLEAGAGKIIHGGTVYINYAGYYENAPKPFDFTRQPLCIDMKNNEILPGLLIGVKSMLEGELAMFIFTHHWMYGLIGYPPRITPKASSVFYVRLLKCVLTPRPLVHSYEQVMLEAESKLSQGRFAFKDNNYHSAIGFFKNGANILQSAKLEVEAAKERHKEEMLIRLLTNLAISYIKVEQALKACAACIELKRIINIWEYCKIVYINGKALRMIGAHAAAKKMLNRALELRPNDGLVIAELLLIKKEECQKMVNSNKNAAISGDLVSQRFKDQVNEIIKDFKMDPEARSIEMPAGLDPAMMDYITQECIKENLCCNTNTLDYYNA